MPLSDQANCSTSNSRNINCVKIPNIKIDTGEHNTNYNVGTDDKLLIFDTLEQAQNWIVSYEAEHGYIFVKVKTIPFESEAILDDLLTKLSRKIHWLLTKHFSNKGFAEWVPFIILNGHRTLHCHHGPDRHKAFKLKRKIKSQMKENPPVLRVRLQPSKKLECPAKIRLNQRLFFPDHKLASYASHHEKNKAMHDLKQLVGSSTNSVKKEARIMICLNYANANKHSDHKIGAEDCER
uniref:Uncharacterized protein n=1 Tax=Ciona savignyi TaxID=51511 RepID=H2YHI2_CIOSA